MAIYYIRQNGDDRNDGLSPNSAWGSFAKVFISSLSGGDIVYVGAGIYFGAYIVSYNPTSEIKIIGDHEGVYTGDAGEIIFSQFLNEDTTTQFTTYTLTLGSGRNFFAFENITFKSGSGILNLAGYNLIFRKCSFIYGGSGPSFPGSGYTNAYPDRMNTLFEDCFFFANGGGNFFRIQLSRGTGPDYEVGITFNRCIFFGGPAASVQFLSGGSLAGWGGGVTIKNCIFIGGSVGVQISSGHNISFRYPVIVENCLIHNNTCVSSPYVGAIQENFNVLFGQTVRSNVSIGPNSLVNPQNQFNVCQNKLHNIKRTRRKSFTYSPTFPGNYRGNPLLNEEPRSLYPSALGIMSLIHEGSIVSSTDNTATLSDDFRQFSSLTTLGSYIIKIMSGPGKDETKLIVGNSGSLITGGGRWITNPTNESRYIIYPGPKSQISQVSSGNSLRIVDNYASWPSNIWAGYHARIISGTASGANFIVSGNSQNTLSGYFNLSATPTSGDIYELIPAPMYQGTIGTGTLYSVTDTNSNINLTTGNIWPTGFFWRSNFRLMIYEGSAAGANFAISGNSSTTFFGMSPLSKIPASGDKYIIFPNTGSLSGYYPSGYYPDYSRFRLMTSVGGVSNYNTAIRSTEVTLSGSSSLRLFGPSCQDIEIPVSGGKQNDISVHGYFDSFYSGIKPSLVIFSNSGISVPQITGTMVGSSGQWEKITVSINPSRNGVVTARMLSLCTGIGGSAYFDAFSTTIL